jgi:hypothetical protein
MERDHSLYLDTRDAEYIEAMQDELVRDAAYCAVTTYRRPERLNIGDPAPIVNVVVLENERIVPLQVANGRPLVLFYGSYT